MLLENVKCHWKFSPSIQCRFSLRYDEFIQSNHHERPIVICVVLCEFRGSGNLYYLSHRCAICNDIMMTSSNGTVIRVTGPLWGEPTDHHWFSLTEASGAEVCSILWYVLEQTVEQILRTPVTWNTIALISRYDVTVMIAFYWATEKMTDLENMSNALIFYYSCYLNLMYCKGIITGVFLSICECIIIFAKAVEFPKIFHFAIEIKTCITLWQWTQLHLITYVSGTCLNKT